MATTSTIELQRVLKEANIQKGILIDDYFDDPKLEILIPQNWPLVRTLLNEIFSDWIPVEEDDIDIKNAIALFSDVSLVEKQAFALRITSNSSVNPEDGGRIKQLIDLFKTIGIEFDTFPAFDFTVSKLKPNNELNAKRLAFVDLDLRRAEGGEFAEIQGGAKLIRRCLENSEINEVTIFAILTHECDLDNELEYHSKLATQFSLDPSMFIVISKKRLDIETEEAILEGIKMSLINLDAYGLKSKISTLFTSAMEVASSSLAKMSVSGFFHAIVKSSAIEGVTETEALFRLMWIFLGDSIASKFASEGENSDIRIRIEKTIAIAGTNWEPASNLFKAELLSLMHLEKFEGEDINKVFSPVSNGDVFEIDGSEYILLVQPCDLQLRTNGERTTSVVTLLKIAEPPIISEQSLKCQKDHKLVPKIGNASEISFWDTAGAKKVIEYSKENYQIGLDILDLTSYNPDGKAIFARSTFATASLLLPESGRERAKALLKGFERAMQEYQKDNECCQASYSFINEENRKRVTEAQINNLRPQTVRNLNKSKIPEILKKAHFQGLSRNSKILPIAMEFENEFSLTYSIRRVKRVREPYATFYLLGYSQNRARPGMPGSLVEES